MNRFEQGFSQYTWSLSRQTELSGSIEVWELFLASTKPRIWSPRPRSECLLDSKFRDSFELQLKKLQLDLQLLYWHLQWQPEMFLRSDTCCWSGPNTHQDLHLVLYILSRWSLRSQWNSTSILGRKKMKRLVDLAIWGNGARSVQRLRFPTARV